ncbi:MAG: O-antigen ligase family protein [Granulosicoccus sp.]
MIDRSTASSFQRSAHWVLLIVFNLFILVSWMPRITTIGGTDIGVSAVLLAMMVPLLLVLPNQTQLDEQARHLGIAIFACLSLVIFWGYLGMYRLDNPMRAGRLLLSLGQGIIIVLVVTRLLSPRAIQFSLAICTLMLTFVGILSLYGYLGGQPVTLTYLQRDRSSGLFKNPNQYGMIASMAVPFAAACFFQYKRRWLAVFLLLAAWVALLMAASKTNMVIALLTMMMTLTFGLLSAKRGVFLLAVFPAIAGFIYFGGMPILEFFNPRAAGIIQDMISGGSGESNTVDQRMELWSYSVHVMQTSPWFGEGTGVPIDVITQTHSHSHNVFLDLGRTVGIPGLLGSLLFMILITWLAFRTLAKVAAISQQHGEFMHGRAVVIGAAFSAISYMLSNQMSDSLGPSTSVFLWLCLGLLLKRHEILFRWPMSHLQRSNSAIRQKIVRA